MTRSDRRLTAIMFADMVGFSGLTNRNETLALEVRDTFLRLARPIFPEFGGRLIKTIGDGILAEFGSALRATCCAVALQKLMADHNRTVPKERWIRIRIGLHLGDVEHQDGDVLGDGVNIASRIEPLAEPGGILMSEHIYAQVANKLDLPFENLGARSLKNIATPMTVYRIASPETVPDATISGSRSGPSPANVRRGRWVSDPRNQKITLAAAAMLGVLLLLAASAVAFIGGPRAAAPDRTMVADGPPLPHAFAPEQGSIAVLPFVNLSADRDQEFFSDGLTTELLNVLAQLPELRVASRTSAFAFKGSSAPIDSVARALNVAHVLEGSVRRDGDRLRVTVQLTRADNGFHVWSNNYDRELRGVFEIQDEIARAIVQALQLRLGSRGAADRLAREETADPEAHALVLRAQHLILRGTVDGHARALEFLDEAVRRDPAYARAHAILSLVLLDQAYRGFGSRDTLHPRAREAGELALALDPDLPDAHYAMALLHWRDWRFQLAEAHFRRTLEQNPGHAVARSARAWLLFALGRADEGLAEAGRAVELDPVSPNAVHNLAALSFFAGDADRAIHLAHRALELLPEHPHLLSTLANMYAESGRPEEAHETAERALARAPNYLAALFSQALAHARAGRRAEAEAIIRQVEGMPNATAYTLARAWAALNEDDRVFELLDLAVTEREPAVTEIGMSPAFAQYRDDPRMALLRQRIGLP